MTGNGTRSEAPVQHLSRSRPTMMNSATTLPTLICLVVAIESLSSPNVQAQQSAVERATVHSMPGFRISSPQVELNVTETGGHMAPVTFFRDAEQPIQPYYISPWQDEPREPIPAPVMVPLRGDFFCMPFGGNTTPVPGEAHPPHGEVSGSEWKAVGAESHRDVTTLTLELSTNVRRGTIRKELSLVDGQNVVYSRHTINGFAGKVPLGHHATLAMPDQEGSVRIATSAIRFGMTFPGMFSRPSAREYQRLLPGTKWTDLSRVPQAWKNSENADLTRLPGPAGYADLVQLVNDTAAAPKEPAWTTATFAEKGYVWFSLKDPEILRTTVFWMENRGRHAYPWNGRNNCLGLEDVTSFFAEGLAESTSENALTQQGVPTALELKSDHPTAVNYIQGVAKIPKDFDVVKNIKFESSQITLTAASGAQVNVPVRWQFIESGQL